MEYLTAVLHACGTVRGEPGVLGNLFAWRWTADGVIPFPVTRSGKWIEECVYFWDDLTSLFDDDNIPIGERYFAFTTFHLVDVDVASLVATLESDEDTILLLWDYEVDHNGEYIENSLILVEANDGFDPGNTNSRIEWEASAAKRYILDLMPFEPEPVGEFTLTIEDVSPDTPNPTAV